MKANMGSSATSAVLLAGCLWALAGCGRARDDHSSPAGGNAGAEAGGASSEAAGSSGNAGSAASAAAGFAGSAGAVDALAPTGLRRLTSRELEASVSDALGTTAPAGRGLSDFDIATGGFDNDVAANDVSEALYLRYLEAAEAVADELFANPDLRSNVVDCEQPDDAACVRRFVTQVGLRLFRRPLSEAEVAGYQKAYARARTRNETHDGALEEALVAELVSAQFLFRMELVPQAGAPDTSQYELAARLSYLLWSSAPDPALLEAAASNQLSSDEQLGASVARLLEDPKAARFSRDFAGQWLGARPLVTPVFLPLRSPSWSPAVTSAAEQELLAFFAELLQPGREWRGFLDSRAHFVNAALAPVYDLQATGDALQRVELTMTERQGILGLAAFLSQTSGEKLSSPSRRGAWILERLLCSPLGPLPADMPGYFDEEWVIRKNLESLNAQPECASCHSRIDPLGLALEQYDPIGYRRPRYRDSSEIDTNVVLHASPELPDGLAVGDLAQLSDALAASPAFNACATQKLYSYAFGRAVSDAERAKVEALTAQWQSGPLTFRDLIVHLVETPDFRSPASVGEP